MTADMVVSDAVASLQAWARDVEQGKPIRFRAHDEPAFVLTARPWSESSLIAELFTRDYGRVAVVVKGAKRGYSRFRGLIEPFAPLMTTFSGTGDVKNLTNARWLGGMPLLTGDALMTGFYINELIVTLTVREDPCPTLFAAYTEVMAQVGVLVGAPLQAALRTFEMRLLEYLGWGQSAKEILEQASAPWVVRNGELMRVHPEPGETVVSDSAVRCIISGAIDETGPLKEVRAVLRHIIGYYVGRRGLNTRRSAAVWAQF